MWIPESEKMYLHDPSRNISKVPISRKIIYRSLAILTLIFLYWHFFIRGSSDPRELYTSLERASTSNSFNTSTSSNSTSLESTSHAAAKGPGTYSKELVAFWHEFTQLLIDSEPPVPLEDDETQALIYSFNHKDNIPTVRQETLKVKEHDVQVLRQSHVDFVEAAQELAPNLPYLKGSRGIVTTAAGQYLPELIVSLRILRRTGSKLPVEVFMETPESFERGICEEVLPNLNAKCLIFSEILGTGKSKVNIGSYQYKVFAMLFSTFDDVLLLDADNLAVHRPEDLMDAEPYSSTGLVTWPDYWVNTMSPAFYEIASIENPPPLNERASSESGQLLFSKSKQNLTLLLLVYYNLYGFTHYYTLLSQHALGQGDKETYLGAAMALNATFYNVKSDISTTGFNPKGPGAGPMGDFQGTGCIQRDPRDDANPFFTDVRPAFLHAQTYKLNAAILPERYFNEINGRMFGSEEHMKEVFNGRDIEKEVWEELVWSACDVGHYFKDFQDREEEICQTVKWIFHSIFG